jgi:flagellar biosynthesis regulator FlbT
MTGLTLDEIEKLIPNEKIDIEGSILNLDTQTVLSLTLKNATILEVNQQAFIIQDENNTVYRLDYSSVLNNALITKGERGGGVVA